MPEEPKSTIKENSVGSLCEIMNCLNDLVKAWNISSKSYKLVLWFRGNVNHNYFLIPSIYRKYQDSKGSIEDEQKRIIFDFMNRKRHLIHKFQTAPNMVPENNNYLWLSIMQHYGYPTCLLDFSENLIISILFALREYFDEETIIASENPPCIWVLNPLKLNKITYTKKFPKYFESGSENYIPSMDQIKSNSYEFLPNRAAIFSPMISDRIQAQTGTFITFPLDIQETNKEITFKDNSLEKHDNAGEFLEKWIIRNPDRVTQELKLMGYNYSDLFPRLGT